MPKRVPVKLYPLLLEWERFHLVVAAASRGDSAEWFQLVKDTPLISGAVPDPRFVVLMDGAAALLDDFERPLAFLFGWMQAVQTLRGILDHPLYQVLYLEGSPVRIVLDQVKAGGSRELGALIEAFHQACRGIGVDPGGVLAMASPAAKAMLADMSDGGDVLSPEAVESWRVQLQSAWDEALACLPSFLQVPVKARRRHLEDPLP